MEVNYEQKRDKLKINVTEEYKVVLNESQSKPLEITEVTNKLTGEVEKILSINPKLVCYFKE